MIEGPGRCAAAVRPGQKARASAFAFGSDSAYAGRGEERRVLAATLLGRVTVIVGHDDASYSRFVPFMLFLLSSSIG